MNKNELVASVSEASGLSKVDAVKPLMVCLNQLLGL